jgi:Flp pilus assembly protein TadB
MRTRPDQPHVITDAQESADDEFDRRRRKYGIMMALRAVCVVAAALTYHVSVFLALGFILAGAILPWCAVLIANDRPPKRRMVHTPHQAPPAERTLPSGSDARTIDG